MLSSKSLHSRIKMVAGNQGTMARHHTRASAQKDSATLQYVTWQQACSLKWPGHICGQRWSIRISLMSSIKWHPITDIYLSFMGEEHCRTGPSCGGGVSHHHYRHPLRTLSLSILKVYWLLTGRGSISHCNFNFDSDYKDVIYILAALYRWVVKKGCAYRRRKGLKRTMRIGSRTYSWI